MTILTVWMSLILWMQVAAPDTVQSDTLTQPAVQDTIPGAMEPDTTALGFMDAEDPDEVVMDTVKIWQYRFADGFDVSETDSTMRWTRLLNLFDKFHGERGAITYRLGTKGRMDGIDLHTFETRHMNLEMEGLILNDPLTGAVNWNRLPIHKIKEFSEADYGAVYRSKTRLRDHYLVEPRTYLNFDESKFDHRSLEFAFTQNLRQTTNLEFSFWDRRDGGGYNRQGVEGRQGVVRLYHQLNDNWMLKTAYINNALDREEPFGYVITDPNFFAFNRFVETPQQANANSNQTSTDLYLQAHHRRGTDKKVSSEFGLHYQVDKWSLSYQADTLATEFRNIEAYARQHVDIGSAEITGTGRVFFWNEAENRNLEVNQWFGGRGDIDITQPLLRSVYINANASFTTWDDNRSSSDLSGRLVFEPSDRLRVSLFGGLLSRAPDIQASYWASNEFAGNPDLPSETSMSAGAMTELGIGRYLSIGVRGDYREVENAVFVRSTEGVSNFVTIDPYNQYSGTGWIGLDSRVFEGEISGTFKTYESAGLDPLNQRLNTLNDRVWIKGHLYWKNYLFDRATYVKAGVSGMISPNPFTTAEFITPLNRWQHGTNDFMNPSYHRLDLDVSARIRWFMVLIKWENILDRVQQLGYFESTGYPMPERRFSFGLRVLFTN